MQRALVACTCTHGHAHTCALHQHGTAAQSSRTEDLMWPTAVYAAAMLHLVLLLVTDLGVMAVIMMVAGMCVVLVQLGVPAVTCTVLPSHAAAVRLREVVMLRLQHGPTLLQTWATVLHLPR